MQVLKILILIQPLYISTNLAMTIAARKQYKHAMCILYKFRCIDDTINRDCIVIAKLWIRSSERKTFFFCLLQLNIHNLVFIIKLRILFCVINKIAIFACMEWFAKMVEHRQLIFVFTVTGITANNLINFDLYWKQ